MLYIVIRVGVYRHEIPGVFDNGALAIKMAKELIGAEPDDYHDMEVLCLELNAIVEDPELFATITRKDEAGAHSVIAVELR